MVTDASRTEGTDAQEDSVLEDRHETRKRDVAYLFFQHLHPESVPPRIVALNGTPHTFGRVTSSTKADTQIDDRKISKQHANINRTALGWSLTDLDSRNGTFVEGHPAPPQQRVSLSDGNVIRFGDSVAVFRLGDPPLELSTDSVLPGNSPAMNRARAHLSQIGPLKIPVLILGETGTGKEYAARAIHAGSGAPIEKFVAVNCGELSKSLSRAELFGSERGAFTDAKEARQGLVAAADGGTLFLDEVGELALEVQVELLRFLEAGTYRPLGGTQQRKSSARVVAATHVDLAAAVEANRFRQDLYARLKAVISPVRMPPLRQRREDIVPWVFRFMASAATLLNVAPRRISAGFAESIMLHGWADNLRALRGAVGSAMLASVGPEGMRAADLPKEVLQERVLARAGTNPVLPKKRAPIKLVDRQAVVEALEAEGGVMTRVAERLGVERRKLYRLCKGFGVSPEDYRQSLPVSTDAKKTYLE